MFIIASKSGNITLVFYTKAFANEIFRIMRWMWSFMRLFQHKCWFLSKRLENSILVLCLIFFLLFPLHHQRSRVQFKAASVHTIVDDSTAVYSSNDDQKKRLIYTQMHMKRSGIGRQDTHTLYFHCDRELKLIRELFAVCIFYLFALFEPISSWHCPGYMQSVLLVLYK